MSSVIEYFSAMTDQSFIAQIVGFVPLILALFVFIHNSRKKIIFFKTCTDFLWAIHFLLLGELSGGVINIINTMRNLVFSQKGKKLTSNKYIPILFCLLISICTIITAEGIKSIFPLVGSCLATIGFWQNSPKRIRFFNFLGVLLWLVYGFLTLSFSTILSNIISITSILLPTIIKKRDDKTNR